jgi:hypothetical protein
MDRHRRDDGVKPKLGPPPIYGGKVKDPALKPVLKANEPFPGLVEHLSRTVESMNGGRRKAIQ